MLRFNNLLGARHLDRLGVQCSAKAVPRPAFPQDHEQLSGTLIHYYEKEMEKKLLDFLQLSRLDIDG